MLCAAWPYVRTDLASTRKGAAVFMDPLDAVYGAVGRQNWIDRWTKIGDAHRVSGDRHIERRAFDEAAEAWLCALTAFEVARRLVDERDPESGDVLAKVVAAVERFASLEQKVERVQIACSDQAEFPAYYLPAQASGARSPAVICIGNEEEAGAMLLGRLLPALMGRGMSALLVSRDDIPNDWRGQVEISLSSCLDYLSVLPHVDADRIGVYGEGLSAALATDLATSDRRVAAAVCDAGVWNWARTRASLGWITGCADADEDAVPARRLRLAKQLKCPVLVIAGGRGIVSEAEAINLQADCAAAGIDLELAMSQISRTPAGEIENFVTFEDGIFGWLEHKLAVVHPRNYRRTARH